MLDVPLNPIYDLYISDKIDKVCNITYRYIILHTIFGLVILSIYLSIYTYLYIYPYPIYDLHIYVLLIRSIKYTYISDKIDKGCNSTDISSYYICTGH